MLQRNPNSNWPPDYGRLITWRIEQAEHLATDEVLLAAAFEYYKDGPNGCIAFINHWCDTFDPRNSGTGKPTRMPFVLFKRQEECVQFVLACIDGQASGLIEKSRDMGVTWICVCVSVWFFLFHKGTQIGWGSRIADLVDEIGVIDSIFEKMRYVLRSIPSVFLPADFNYADMGYMKIYSLSNECTISGDSGDNIGRGARTKASFVDEAAHLLHPEAIEASLGDTTRSRIDISSVNGLGNPFEKKRRAGVDWEPGQEVVRIATNVLVMDWRDHPEKTQEWYDEREAKAIGEGMEHIFRSEVDRDYAASVEGVIVPAKWAAVCVDAHVRLGIEETGGWSAALDVADGGGDTNALAKKRGIVIKSLEEWGGEDGGDTTRRAVTSCAPQLLDGKLDLQYDAVGVGSSVKAESNRLVKDNLMPRRLRFMPWFAGAKVLNPEGRVVKGDKQSPLNKDFFKNLKAQAWWDMRLRVYRTFCAIRQLEGDDKYKDFTYDPDDLISFSSDMPLLRKFMRELSQATKNTDTGSMKLVVDKTPDGTKSPNLADAVIMCCFPASVPPISIPPELMQRVAGLGSRVGHMTGILRNTRRRL